jgi:peptidoglycan/xylan/chitin deacetylase (PgdA/CDA1 family)
MNTLIGNLTVKSINILDTLLSREPYLSILIYHRVLPNQDKLRPSIIDATRFNNHIRHLSNNYNVIPLIDAIERLQNNTLPKKSLCITFDDGYLDNVEVALPILKKHKLTATFFVSTGFLDGKSMWNDLVIESVRAASQSVLDLSKQELGKYDVSTLIKKRRTIRDIILELKYFPPDERLDKIKSMMQELGLNKRKSLMMNPKQITELYDAGMGIGAHTVNHPILTAIDEQAARFEIESGKRELEGIINSSVDLFAYPNGKPGQDYGPEHVTIVKNLGFVAAVSTAWGVSRSDSDIYQLPRFTPWDRDCGRFSLRLFQNSLRSKAHYV